MRLLFSFVSLLLIHSILVAQSAPDGTRYIETVYATQFKKGDTLKHTESIVYYDKDWKILYGDYGKSDAEEAERSIDLIVKADYQVTAIVLGASDTQYYLVRVTDSIAHTEWTYQIIKGDTVVKQKWVFDSRWKDYDLYNIVDGVYVKEMTFRYDSVGKLIYYAWYDTYSNAIMMEETYVTDSTNGKQTYYRSTAGSSPQVMSVSERIDSLNEKTSFYYDLTGYVYGIEIQTQKGGFSISKKSEFHGNALEETYNRKGVITSRIRREIKML